MKKITYFLWILITSFLFLYSYTQVDLNLTLTRFPLFDQTVKWFQLVGYFQRPLSTIIFLLLIVSLYILYLMLLIIAKNGGMSRREFWVLILLTSLILLFSYPAFSYDIFNYMFDTKIIVVYHQNPWLSRPLDFPGDSWLSFMHWTHRPSVYPPVWIGLSIPFFLAGFNIFLLQLLSFKILIIGSFILSIFLLEKLLQGKRNIILVLVLYAFNPLMLIENSVSAHNDIVMIFFALLSIWFLIKRKSLFSFIFYILSFLIKYVTAIFLPMFLLILPLSVIPNLFLDLYNKMLKQVQHDTRLLYRTCLILATFPFLIFITRVEIQPWYLVWLLPFVVLSEWKFLYPVVIGFSLGLLLRYTPFLYLGNWDSPVPIYKFWLTAIPLVLSAFVSLWLIIRRRKYENH